MTALLLEEVSKDTQNAELRMANKITSKLNANNILTNTLNEDIRTQLEMNVNFLKHTASSQVEVTISANALVGKLKKLCKQVEKTFNNTLIKAKEAITSTTPYKDTLINGQTQNTLTLQTPFQHKLLNQIKIKECQMLVKFEENMIERM